MEDERCLNNWDLDAVVRLACRRCLSPPPRPQVNDPFDSFPPPPPPPPPPAAAPYPANEQDAEWHFPDLRAGGHDGDELLRALLAAQPTMPPPPALPTLPTPPPQLQKPQPQAVLPPAEAPAPARAALASAPLRSGRQMASAAVPRSKRRKNQVKKVVCRVPADGSSSDVWAWRKYGQKPIKGSPYPRGYYRCSSSKGCAARKQVERCRADPNTFILTYTGEHNHAAPTHRNSLAGTTRHKFPSPPPPSLVVAGSGDSQRHQQQQASPSAPSTSAGLSPTTPLRTPSMEDDDEEEDELLVEDMEMAGEDELLFLSGDAADSAAPMSSLFDVVDEPFLGSPWASVTAGSPAAGVGS